MLQAAGVESGITVRETLPQIPKNHAGTWGNMHWLRNQPMYYTVIKSVWSNICGHLAKAPALRKSGRLAHSGLFRIDVNGKGIKPLMTEI